MARVTITGSSIKRIASEGALPIRFRPIVWSSRHLIDVVPAMIDGPAHKPFESPGIGEYHGAAVTLEKWKLDQIAAAGAGTACAAAAGRRGGRLTMRASFVLPSLPIVCRGAVQQISLALLPLVCSITAVIWEFGLLKLFGKGLDPFAILVPFLILASALLLGIQDRLRSWIFKPGEHFFSDDRLPEGATFDPAVHGHWSRQVGPDPLVTAFVRG